MASSKITVFGSHRKHLDEWTQQYKALCQSRGVDFKGPQSPSPARKTHAVRKVTPEHSQLSLDKLPGWFRELELSDEEIQDIQSAIENTNNPKEKVVFKREFEVYDDGATASLLNIERPDGVFIRLSISERNMPESTGNEPSGYDPGKDYVTDIDYEAHHGG